MLRSYASLQVIESLNFMLHAVAIAVAILEHWQRRFCKTNLENCNLEFPKMEDTHPRLLVALIISYKRSTQITQKEELSTKRKTSKKNTRKHKSREKWRLKNMRNCRDQSEIGSFFSFLIFYLFMWIYLMAETLLFIFLSLIMNWIWL